MLPGGKSVFMSDCMGEGENPGVGWKDGGLAPCRASRPVGGRRTV